MDYRKIMAIDAGLRNFAYCVVDTQNWREPLVWNLVDLWPPHPGKHTKPSNQEILDVTMRWFRKNRQLFEDVDEVIFETQIRKPFIVMNTVLQAMVFDKYKQVSPMTVGAFWKLPKTRDAKKRAAIDLVARYAAIPRSYNAKQDDLADAWLLAVWGLIEAGGLGKNSVVQIKD